MNNLVGTLRRSGTQIGETEEIRIRLGFTLGVLLRACALTPQRSGIAKLRARARRGQSAPHLPRPLEHVERATNGGYTAGRCGRRLQNF